MRKTLIAATLAASLATLSGGCMLGPDYLRPAVDSPTAFRFDGQSAQQLADTAWWQQFGDPVLDELLAEALRNNRDLLIASARIEEYAGYLGATRAGLFPQVGLGGEVAKQRNLLPGTTRKDVYDSYEVSLGVSWEIDLWGRIRRQSEAANARLVATEEGRRGVVLSLVANVANGYIALRDLDRQLEIARQTTGTRRQSYELFKERFAGGVVSLLELNQARSQFEEAAASIPVLEKSIAQQENALSLLLGRNPGPIKRGRTIEEISLPAIPAGLPSELLERRPDLRQAEQNLIAANAQIGAAKAAFFPSISLTGLLGVASASLGNLFEGQSKIWQYAGAVNQPIFTGGSLLSQLRVAEAQQKQALLSYQQAIQNAFREVDDALVARDRTQSQLAAQRRQVDALRQYAETARLRYDNGYTSYIEVLDAERSLFSAELSMTQTQQTLLAATVGLYKAMGGGWIGVADQISMPAPPPMPGESAAAAPAK